MASKVSSLGAIDWVSDAADAFRIRQEAFPPKLELVSTRLQSTGVALQRFATQLEEIQSSALGYLSSAQQLQVQLQQVTALANEQRHYNDQQDLETLLGKPRVPWPGPNYIAQQSELQANFTRVQSAFNELVSEYQLAAQSCANQLQRVSHDALANNLFSVFAHYGAIEISDIKTEIKDVSQVSYYLAPGFARAMHDIANVAGILSMIPVLNVVAIPVFLVTSGLALGDDALLMSEHRLDGGWGTIAADGAQLVSAGLFAKASDMIKASETVVGVSHTALESGEPFLESFPKLIKFESVTSDVVGEGTSVLQWLPEHTAFVQRLLNDVAPDSMPVLHTWIANGSPV
jgi:hypothetical protein